MPIKRISFSDPSKSSVEAETDGRSSAKEGPAAPAQIKKIHCLMVMVILLYVGNAGFETYEEYLLHKNEKH
jgi:hypothetical protein